MNSCKCRQVKIGVSIAVLFFVLALIAPRMGKVSWETARRARERNLKAWHELIETFVRENERMPRSLQEAYKSSPSPQVSPLIPRYDSVRHRLWDAPVSVDAWTCEYALVISDAQWSIWETVLQEGPIPCLGIYSTGEIVQGPPPN